MNDNFGGYCENISRKALRCWFQKCVEYRVIARWRRRYWRLLTNFVNYPLVKGSGPTLIAEKLEETKEIRFAGISIILNIIEKEAKDLLLATNHPEGKL